MHLTPPHTQKVYLRKLDPKTRLPPRGDAHVSLWSPKTITLQAHRLGLTAMCAGSHLIATAGKSGSVKLTPEGALRVLAMDAGVRLPHSASVVAEALTALLLGGTGQQAAAAAAAVLKTAGSAASSVSAAGGLLSQYASSLHGAASSGQLQQALANIDEQLVRAAQHSMSAQHRRPSAGQLSPQQTAGVGSRGGSVVVAGAMQQQQQQQPAQGSGGSDRLLAFQPPTPPGISTNNSQQQEPAQPQSQPQPSSQPNSAGGRRGSSTDGGGSSNAGAGGGSSAPSRERSLARQPSSSWPHQERLQLDSPWIIPFEELRLARVIGEGSYGHVRIGSWHEVRFCLLFVGRRGYARCSLPLQCPLHTGCIYMLIQPGCKTWVTHTYPSISTPAKLPGLYTGLCLGVLDG